MSDVVLYLIGQYSGEKNSSEGGIDPDGKNIGWIKPDNSTEGDTIVPFFIECIWPR